MKEKFIRFMQGRYGNDRLGQTLMLVAMFFLLLSFFVGDYFYFISVAVLGYAYYRMLSRQIAKRAAENQKYLAFEWKVRSKVQKKKKEMQQRKTHRIYACPSCKQKIRVPKGRGKIAIRCQKCGTEFVKKS